jgi:hypothetical protein
MADTWKDLFGKLSMTTVLSVTLGAIFLGQALAGTIIGQYLGFASFKAGPVLQMLFYFAGAMGILYSVQWLRPGAAPGGISNMVTMSIAVSIFCWIIAWFVIPIVPGLGFMQTAFPMHAGTGLAPLSIIPMP